MNEWISVKDKQPLKIENGLGMSGVIAAIRESDGQMRTGYRIFEIAKARNHYVSRWLYPWNRISNETITHWMPLPEPPKEKQ